MKRYRCKICGRDKFEKPTPHICGSVYLKHYGRKKYKEIYGDSIFEEINHPTGEQIGGSDGRRNNERNNNRWQKKSKGSF